MKRHCRQFHAFLLFPVLMIFACSADAQTTSAGRWYSGTGSAAGKDMEKIRSEALNRARADALQKAGIEVNSATLSLKSEDNAKLIDFFSEFAESNARGLILDEKGVHFDRPVPLDSTYTIYRITVTVQALVTAPQGSPDPAFEVTLKSDRETYMEYEPVSLKIRATEPGYLTILDIHGDSLNVLYPNGIDRDNYIRANSEFDFPPGQAYSMELETANGASSSADILIAVVTKDDVPFPNITAMGLEGSRLKVAEKSLTTYAKWLYRIPLDRRAADSKAVEVRKEPAR